MPSEEQKIGYDNASLFSRIAFNFVNPLVREGIRGNINESTAAPFLPPKDAAELLSESFNTKYEQVKADLGPDTSPSKILWATYLGLYRTNILICHLWIVAEIGLRVGSPLILRQLLDWFIEKDQEGLNPSHWKGWVYASMLGVFGYGYTLVHHRLFFRCMRMGFEMRQQAIAAVQRKVLKLNSVAISDVTAGKIVNLVSNDVRRFDDAAVYGFFLLAGPAELCVILVLIGLRLGFAAAFAGVSTLLLLIPVQGFLGRYIGKLRQSVAEQTDDRVRLTGEVISGVLAAKMLCLEGVLLCQIAAIRNKEASYLKRMSRIRAINMSVNFSISPVCSLVVFAVARVTNAELTVSSLFFTLALLNLPKLYMCEFFVRAVEVMSELRVSMRRIGAFLALPEPPEPYHSLPASEDSTVSKPAIVVNGADFDWNDRSWIARHYDRLHQGSAQADGSGKQTPSISQEQLDYRRLMAAASTKKKQKTSDGKQAAKKKKKKDSRLVVSISPSSTSAAVPETASNDQLASPTTKSITLPHLQLDIPQGALVAIAGPVGAGKSSVLAALLGELQPIHSSSVVEGGEDHHQQQQSEVVVKGSVAYCSQIPWIVAGTVRDNILFGKPYDEARYNQVLKSCALDEDIVEWAGGDLVEIGERGISISGGQKARLALARAAYSRADVQLLDDPLSAVDPRVGKILFEACISDTGAMQGSTRILVTHQRQYLPACDLILVMRDGRVIAQGTYSELIAGGDERVLASVQQGRDELSGLGAASVDAVSHELDNEQAAVDVSLSRLPPTISSLSLAESSAPSLAGDESAPYSDDQNGTTVIEPITTAVTHKKQQQRGVSFKQGTFDNNSSNAAELTSSPSSLKQWFTSVASFKSFKGKAEANGKLERQETSDKLRRFISRRFAGNPTSAAGGDGFPGSNSQLSKAELAAATSKGQLTSAEDRAAGSVDMQVYYRYFKHMGLIPVVLIAIGLLGGQALFLSGDYYLAKWASQPPEEQDKSYWVTTYAAFVAGIVVIAICRTQLFFIRSLHASSELHNLMADRVIHAPLSFFHTNPSGRVLNRFSKDQGALDEQLPQVFFDTLQAGMMVLGAFILLVIVVPFILPVFIPLGIAFVILQRRYVLTSREVKRFEAVTRSPVYSGFSAILRGLPTIRAYNVAERFRQDFLALLTKNSGFWFCFITTARWIGFRLDFMVALLLTVAPLLMMAVHDRLSTRLVGLALTQSLNLAGMLQWMVRQSAEVENNMTSVERLLAYCDLEQEPPTVEKGGAEPPANWPVTGTITYNNVTAIYRQGLPPVLQNLLFTIPGGQSCGIVGRTGSGKSSLVLTLFRLIPVTGGQILLDDVDIASIGLDALRRQIAVIPQDPILFSGTLRANLDPNGTSSDAELWDALRTAQLKTVVQELGGLDQEIRDCGDNLSVGQRQLLCLARALLQDAAVLALDEATANVDRATDALIQSAIKEACSCRRSSIDGSGGSTNKRTLLVVAHRLDTIMDCDNLLVLGSGKLLEYGPPKELANGAGMFSRMVRAARAASNSK